MDLIAPVFAAAVALTPASLPSIQSEPYVGDPAVVMCEYLMDGRWQPKVKPQQADLGTVCQFQMPSGLSAGFHTARGRFWFKIDGKDTPGPSSATFYFRRYDGTSGATFWTWENAIVCDPDCVSQ